MDLHLPFAGMIAAFGILASFVVLRVHFKRSFSLKRFSLAIAVRSIIRITIGLGCGLLLSVFIQLFSNSVPFQLVSAALIFVLGMSISALLYRKALNRILRASFGKYEAFKGHIAESALVAILGAISIALVERLSVELAEAKADGKQLATAQGQLLEQQRQISQLQNDLSLSERERESLTLALRAERN